MTSGRRSLDSDSGTVSTHLTPDRETGGPVLELPGVRRSDDDLLGRRPKETPGVK